MRIVCVTAASAAAILAVLSVSALAQEAPVPADAADQLPPVDVIQKAAPAPAAKKKSAAKKKQVSPAPQAPPAFAGTAPMTAGPERAPDGRVVGNAPNLNPVSPSTGILPTDMQDYVGAGTRLTPAKLDEQRPLTNHDALNSVPGVMVVNDDGMARHSGIGVRGSPMRRSRKVLVMEDGLPINFSTYLDPSTHYTPPTERVDSIEVLRGPVVSYGPLNNHGVVNFRNLSPFGPDETVIKAAIGYTEESQKDWNNFRHIHTRQTMGNFGIVASYSGAEGAGAWDSEELRYNDFYGALGWKGTDQDLTISGGYFRQRDQYDEINFAPQGDPNVIGPGGGYAEFFANRRNKLGTGQFEDNPFYAGLSSYNADYWRLVATHNLYIDEDTTLTSRAYYSDNERNRMYFQSEDAAGFRMRGRERHYTFFGAESRIEFANRAFFGGMTQDIQAGVRYEHHEFHNCNTTGGYNQVLDASTNGVCVLPGTGLPGRHPVTNDSSRLQDIEADSFSAFVQSAIHVTRDLTVTPGVRFESYDINYVGFNQDPAELDGIKKSNHENVLPMIAFAWNAMPYTTIYGGYHQGITPQVTRGPLLPLPDEKGDNFQVGVRSTAIRGLSFDVAYFHSNIDNYQVKSPEADDAGNNLYGTVDEVEIDGFEGAVRLDTRPITGGTWNFFGEAAYTYANSRVKSDADASLIGNYVPEVPRHFANLTVGAAYKNWWDASVTWTYRGGFFTDVENGELDWDPGDEVEAGYVDSVWLLSARSNLKVTDNLTLFVSGTNLLNEFYLSDIDEGMKPGAARTVMGGFTLKLQ